MYKIYKITNLINNKIYIGYTKNELIVRFKQHCKSKDSLIGRAIHKYGKENFIIDLVEESDDFNYIKNVRENYWIKYFKSQDMNIGYNISNGGDGGDNITFNPRREEIRKEKCIIMREYFKNHPESVEKRRLKMIGQKRSSETKKKISVAQKGIKKSEEHRKHLSESTKNRLKNKENHPLYGKHHSKESREKMSKSWDYNKHQTEQSRLKRSLKMKGRKRGPFSKEHLLHLRHPKSQEGRKRIAEVNIKIRSNAPELICFNCGLKSKDFANMKRWHLNNCKYKYSIENMFIVDIIKTKTWGQRINGLILKYDNNIFIANNCLYKGDKLYNKFTEEFLLGKCVSIAFIDKTQNQDGSWSLRFPVLKVIYDKERDM